MTTPMTIGMIGVANFGGYRRSQIRAAGHFKIAAVHDRNPVALKAAAEQESAKACNTVEELLATPGLEGLVISTGADSHADLSIRAMKAGLHVFVEKPLCCSEAEVTQLLSVRAATKRVVGLGHNDCQTDGLYKLIRDSISSGKLGTIAAYEENTSHSGGLEIKKGDWRGLKDRNPGGMLFQCGVHALNGLTHLFGPVAAVQALMRYDANPNTETADVANVLLRHESGLVGTLNCYHITAYVHELRIFGTKGNLYLNTHERTALFQERKNGPKEDRVPVAIPENDPGHGHANLTNWFNACQGRGVARPSLEDGIQAVMPVFAAELSAQQGRLIKLDELSQGVLQHG
ncbi:MAG: Gfo/Idh/MocA family oxidoreductase [Planctomycetota bacterium]|nr:Gfo/Idh/MocA family oxidoreductase [Planctomycetota bacterium]